MQLLRAALAQMVGAAAAWLLFWLFPAALAGPWRLAFLQALTAAMCSRLLRQPPWWIPMHLLFVPALLAAAALQLPSMLYLAAFIAMLLIFRGTVRGDAPLFLSPASVARAVTGIVRQENARSFADLGAGTGSVALPLARSLPQLNVDAWEHAPLTWAVLAWRSRRLANLETCCGSLWHADLSRYDVVYAFLSPTPMPALGEKARREMRPGSLLVSSTFAIPEWTPERVVETGNRGGTPLFCYRIG